MFSIYNDKIPQKSHNSTFFLTFSSPVAEDVDARNAVRARRARWAGWETPRTPGAGDIRETAGAPADARGRRCARGSCACGGERPALPCTD